MRVCLNGHAMSILHRFIFEHASEDSPETQAHLENLEELGLELGAEVTVWYCPPCDFAQAEFAHPETA